MIDRKSIKLADGAEVFEWNGHACYKYNAKLKIAGDTVKVCFYESGILCGYPKNCKPEKEAAQARLEYDKEARFEKTGRTAQRRLYDFVASNLRRHRDYRGKKQTFKFLTLTFREDVKKLDVANKEFKKFIQRLNYHFTGGETFLEYVAVPELQTENARFVWHYHVLFFNLPFLPVAPEMVDKLVEKGRLSAGYDKRDTISYIWGQGSVDICKVKFSDAYDVAGYIAKYIGKGLEGVFEYANEEGLLNRKRFLRSAGLFSPYLHIAFLNKQQRQEIFDYFRRHAKHFKRKGEIGTYFETYFVDSEYIGKLFGINFRSAEKRIAKLRGLFEQYSYGLV